MKTQTLILPACWASALINGDDSGLSIEDKAAMNETLIDNGLTSNDCLGCNDTEFFSKWHDALKAMPLAAMCLEFIFEA